MVALSSFRWTARLPARTLRQLAAIAERQERREFVDPERAANELAEMISRGDRRASVGTDATSAWTHRSGAERLGAVRSPACWTGGGKTLPGPSSAWTAGDARCTTKEDAR